MSNYTASINTTDHFNRLSSASAATASHQPVVHGSPSCCKSRRPRRQLAPPTRAQLSDQYAEARYPHRKNVIVAGGVDHAATSMSADSRLAYWDSAHNSLIVLHPAPGKQAAAPAGGHDRRPDAVLAADQDAAAHELLTAELQLLANAASDRAEMHSILAQQRDNWNKLFHRTLTSTSLTACVLSGLAGAGGQSNVLGLSVSALLLNAGTAAMMAIINRFQPSQLAEEQRTAARLFRKLASDVHFALHVSPHLRQSSSSFFADCKRRLRALEKAFPMPLTPGGLEKFPTKVAPPVLIEPIEESRPFIEADGPAAQLTGWNRQLSIDLKHVAATLRRSDIPKYTGWAENLVKVNKCLAVAAPCFASSAALLNGFQMLTIPTSTLGMWAAVCSVLATFAGSLSNDMQLGMIFELYRNSAGYYANVETSINETLSMPIKERENGALFRQRIAYQLGRWPNSEAEPVVPVDAQEAGTIF